MEHVDRVSGSTIVCRRRLLLRTERNAITPATELNQATPGLPGSLDDRRPFPAYKNIFQFETSASSIAHAGEIRIERRFQSGIGVTGTYRFSRSIDDATLISILPQDSHN